MKRIRELSLVLLVMAIVVALTYGIGTLTQTKLSPTSIPKWEMNKLTLDWTSSADTNAVSGNYTYGVDGEIYRVVFQPDAAGTQPSNQYDVTLLDDDGMDVLLGLGADLSNSANTQIVPILSDGANYYGRVAVHGTLELRVANAGKSKGGKVIIYWK